jgi:hypothetical protein
MAYAKINKSNKMDAKWYLLESGNTCALLSSKGGLGPGRHIWAQERKKRWSWVSRGHPPGWAVRHPSRLLFYRPRGSTQAVPLVNDRANAALPRGGVSVIVRERYHRGKLTLFHYCWQNWTQRVAKGTGLSFFLKQIFGAQAILGACTFFFI